MSKESKEFIQEMLKFFPSTYNSYEESVSRFGEVLETVIIEDIFMPEIIKLLREGENIKLIKNIFNYFEEVSNCGDSHLINIFSITVLEILVDDRDILDIAQKYIGPKTMGLFDEVIQGI
ncbi:resolvase [Anaerocolumna sp. AGMB13025]|uniref:DUF7674 family protein n=1 Tax=Anaerocolumna sp. AGMB13025 TaxID=3039116 RepID=UPI00241E7CD6|nr:resolvase [Anaerocolumna sp. AGMB13025]WFR58538.1 resolvase [Anaerocolumna sp. AGMB13025]